MIIQYLRMTKRLLKKKYADYRYYCALAKIQHREANYRLSECNNNDSVIISLTSYGKRLYTVHNTIKSLLCQTYPPDKIILYLGEDVLESEVPKELNDLKRYGVQIEFVKGNLRPHKKYFYAIQSFPNALVVTVDDDLIYPEYFLELLIKEHLKYPNAVIAARVHIIRFDDNDQILPYMQWEYEADVSKKNESFMYLATGGAGALYPPGSIGCSFFDEELIKTLSYTTDDLWLKAAELKSRTPVKMISSKVWKHTYEYPKAIDNALSNNNVYGGQNDENFRKIINYFKFTIRDFKD